MIIRYGHIALWYTHTLIPRYDFQMPVLIHIHNGSRENDPTTRWPNVGLLILRRWPNINTASVDCVMLAVRCELRIHCSDMPLWWIFDGGSRIATPLPSYLSTCYILLDTCPSYDLKTLEYLYINHEGFLSPARRGRGILVAPWFCPASGVTFSCGRKNSKTTGQIFLKFYYDIPSNMWMCKYFFKDATKIQNGR